ncbi:MAG TPA: di-heme oxidoredictase family protein [Chitinophaga sp.]|uniref:di-heme oxidoreductase family protein n=1 Tax=Chitinophaga sp. TaxID=1869181 RepID=UPI002C07B5A6|nr:di-heme oxidoredictase family protein [Chitinophaga sp.]HVI46706.1 di-heme oxidoredictase family protein [Chitinophaga sp.]
MRNKKLYGAILLLSFPALLMMCRKAETPDDSLYDPRLSGGESTIFDVTSRAFGHSIPGMDVVEQHMHDLGDAQSDQTFVTAPAPVNSGLGPIFNNVSCKSCHHNDGKGSPTAGLNTSSLLVRLSVPGSDEHGGPVSVPGFGLQLQDRSNFGKQPEAKVDITYVDETFTYPDGNTAVLHRPVYKLLNSYKPLPGNLMISARMAPPFFGLGLLDLIPEATIKGFAAQQAKENNGISGKANYVYDPASGKMMLGRYGMKANTATLLTQVAAAYQQDMGVTSYVFPQESSFGQPQYDGLNDDPELPDTILNATVFYIRTLAVPARRNVTDPQIQQGEVLFAQTGCASCHIPTIVTGTDVRFKALSHQRIHPYTDLLLHDLGEGLSDGRPDFLADAREWKTPALWGIGLFEKTNGVPFYLHDGRARTLEEAVLWHDGEAASSKTQFTKLSKNDRENLILFLRSL